MTRLWSRRGLSLLIAVAAIVFRETLRYRATRLIVLHHFSSAPPAAAPPLDDSSGHSHSHPDLLQHANDELMNVSASSSPAALQSALAAASHSSVSHQQSASSSSAAAAAAAPHAMLGNAGELYAASELEVEPSISTRVAAIFREVVYIVALLYLASHELSGLLCNGHSITSYLLMKLSGHLLDRKKIQPALVTAQAALAFDTFWLGSRNPVLRDTYLRIANLCGLLKRHKDVAHYASIATQLSYLGTDLGNMAGSRVQLRHWLRDLLVTRLSRIPLLVSTPWISRRLFAFAA